MNLFSGTLLTFMFSVFSGTLLTFRTNYLFSAYKKGYGKNLTNKLTRIKSRQTVVCEDLFNLKKPRPLGRGNV